MDLFEEGRFSSGCWISAVFWVGWRSLLEDGGQSQGPLSYLGLFHRNMGWIFSMSWCNLDSKSSTGGTPDFQQGGEVCGGDPPMASPLWDSGGRCQQLRELCCQVLKLLTPVPPSNVGKSQPEMFSNTAESGGAFPGKWQHGPDVSQGN